MAIVVVTLWVIDRLIKRRGLRVAEEHRFGGQLIMLALTVVGLVIIVLAMPFENTETQGQLLALLGLAITAVITLASTTFVANAMAGVMLRAVRSFGPGDFIGVGEEFGRVTVRGLFHTEIQTEDRDLTTLPNFYLMSKPIKVVRSSGTIVSATVSLGYDVANPTVRKLLVAAAEEAELQDPFVQVLDLGDYSVTYRVAGFLPEVKQLLSARSRLRVAMLDAFHADNIEMVSPYFMIQRPQNPAIPVIPCMKSAAATRSDTDAAGDADRAAPEDMMFDKAEMVERLQQMQAERQDIVDDMGQLEDAIKGANDTERHRMERGLAFRKSRLAAIDADLARAQEQIAESD